METSPIIFEVLFNPKLFIYTALGLVNLLGLIWFIQWKNSRKHLYKLADKIPNANLSYNPILGHAHHFIGGVEQINKSFDTIFEKPIPGKVWLLNRIMCFTKKPEHAEILLNHPHSLGRSEVYKFLQSAFGNSLVTAKVNKWKNDRKHISPTFNKTNLNSYVEIFSEQSKIFCDVLESYVGKGFFDMLELTERCALDKLCETTMGTKLGAQTGNCTVSKNIHKVMALLFARIMNVLHHNDFVYFNLIPAGRKEAKVADSLRQFANKIIMEKRAQYRMLRQDQVVQTDDKPIRKSLLDQLIELSENDSDLTDQDVLDNITMFLIVGSDASARIASFAFVIMGMYTEYQQKLYDEVIDVIGPDRLIYPEDLSKLIYTDKFLKETMRLFPLAPNIGRNVEEDIDLGDYIVPKGSDVAMGIFAMQRSAEYYPDPLKFDPERFNPEETAKRHPYLFLPFSGGPRSCIGMKYGMMATKTLIAMAVRKFKFETTYKSIEEINVYQAVALTAKDGQPVQVSLR